MKTVRMLSALALAALLAALSGCGSDPADVLFTVNGEEYLGSVLEKEVELQVALNQRRQHLTDEVRLARARKGIRNSILWKKIQTMLIGQAIREAGFEADGETLRVGRAKYAEKYGRGLDYAGLRGKMEELGLGDALDVRFRAEARAEAYLKACFRDELTISDETVRKTIESMRRGDARAEATNAVICATATNVWRRAQAGEDFTALARSYGDPEDDGWMMGDCSRADFAEFEREDEAGSKSNPVWEAVSSLPEGGVTPPLDTPGGLMVYRRFPREGADASTVPTVRLGRIAFRRALKYEPESYEPDFVRRSLEREARGKAVDGIVRRMAQTAEVVFPNGDRGLPKGFSRKVLSMLDDLKEKKEETK